MYTYRDISYTHTQMYFFLDNYSNNYFSDNYIRFDIQNLNSNIFLSKVSKLRISKKIIYFFIKQNTLFEKRHFVAEGELLRETS